MFCHKFIYTIDVYVSHKSLHMLMDRSDLQTTTN